jgi:hypothetical protein
VKQKKLYQIFFEFFFGRIWFLISLEENMSHARHWLAISTTAYCTCCIQYAAYFINRPKVIEHAHWLVKYNKVNMFFTRLFFIDISHRLHCLIKIHSSWIEDSALKLKPRCRDRFVLIVNRFVLEFESYRSHSYII